MKDAEFSYRMLGKYSRDHPYQQIKREVLSAETNVVIIWCQFMIIFHFQVIWSYYPGGQKENENQKHGSNALSRILDKSSAEKI